MPIIAFHGTGDRINPYWGNGDPSYWNMSVPDAVQLWVDFNGCKYERWRKATDHVFLNEHYDCKDDASVVLVMIQGDGHTWTGSYAFVEAQFGKTTTEQSASDVIADFFGNHPVPSRCHTAQEGENCYMAVTEAMNGPPFRDAAFEGRFENLTYFEEYQAELHYGILADCPRPCKRLVQAMGVGDHPWKPPTTTRLVSVLNVSAIDVVSDDPNIIASNGSTRNSTGTVYLYSKFVHWANAERGTPIFMFAVSAFLGACFLFSLIFLAYGFKFSRNLGLSGSFSLVDSSGLAHNEERSCCFGDSESSRVATDKVVRRVDPEGAAWQAV